MRSCRPFLGHEAVETTSSDGEHVDDRFLKATFRTGARRSISVKSPKSAALAPVWKSTSGLRRIVDWFLRRSALFTQKQNTTNAKSCARCAAGMAAMAARRRRRGSPVRGSASSSSRGLAAGAQLVLQDAHSRLVLAGPAPSSELVVASSARTGSAASAASAGTMASGAEAAPAGARPRKGAAASAPTALAAPAAHVRTRPTRFVHAVATAHCRS